MAKAGRKLEEVDPIGAAMVAMSYSHGSLSEFKAKAKMLRTARSVGLSTREVEACTDLRVLNLLELASRAERPPSRPKSVAATKPMAPEDRAKAAVAELNKRQAEQAEVVIAAAIKLGANDAYREAASIAKHYTRFKGDDWAEHIILGRQYWGNETDLFAANHDNIKEET